VKMLKHLVCLNNGTLTKVIFFKWFLPSKHSPQLSDSYSNAFSNSKYKFADIFEFPPGLNLTVNTPPPPYGIEFHSMTPLLKGSTHTEMYTITDMDMILRFVVSELWQHSCLNVVVAM
jgi:hypothetical protein